MYTTSSPRRIGSRVGIAVMLLLAAMLALSGAPAHADHPSDGASGPITWGISPADENGADGRGAIEHMVKPGGGRTDHVVVRNLGDRPLTLDLYTADATLTGGVFDLLGDDEESSGVGIWATAGTGRVTLAPRERKVVPVRIKVPETAEPGDHAGGIVAVLRPKEGTDDPLQVERRVGTRIHLRVAGPVTPQLTIEVTDVRYHHPWLPFAPGSGTASLTVSNTGNIRLAGQSLVEIEGPAGIVLGRSEPIAVPELLPGASLDFEVEFDELAPLGPLNVSAKADALTSGDQELGDSVPPGTDRVTVWALPWATLALLLAVTTGVLVWRRRVSRSRRPAAEADPDGIGQDDPARLEETPRANTVPDVADDEERADTMPFRRGRARRDELR
jgi:hypothetical protein